MSSNNTLILISLTPVLAPFTDSRKHILYAVVDEPNMTDYTYYLRHFPWAPVMNPSLVIAHACSSEASSPSRQVKVATSSPTTLRQPDSDLIRPLLASYDHCKLEPVSSHLHMKTELPACFRLRHMSLNRVFSKPVRLE